MQVIWLKLALVCCFLADLQLLTVVYVMVVFQWSTVN